ncbi:CCR4-NOT regulatory complex component [Cystobasidiomycetes sp. EMM_F5]
MTIEQQPGLAIDVRDLHFTFPSSVSKLPALRGVDLVLPRGSLAILIGSNGAGKSTLLQILAGKRMTRSGAKVLGQDVFFKTPPGVTYLGTEFVNNPVVRSDLLVSHFLDSVGGYRHKARRDRLLDLLDVDLDWRMHEVSDGERRRVQIVQGLMAPWEVLLLDEVTVDLDVLVRSNLLSFLKEECQTRGATVLYATHIFDGLDNIPSHVAHIQLGQTTQPDPIPWPITSEDVPGVPQGVLVEMDRQDRAGSRMLALALRWLQEDKQVRLGLEKQGILRARGGKKAVKDETPSDSESFFRKYDYTASR